MGISPAEAKKLSIWELNAVAERWIEAHAIEGQDGKAGDKLSSGEKDEIWAWMQSRPHSPLTLKEARKTANGARPG